MRIHLSALGCRLNEAELEQWATAFTKAGDQIATEPAEADVLVLNTCAVTREAVRKSRQKLQKLQRDNPQAKLVVSGCYSELEPANALAELGVDLIVPNTRKDELVTLTRHAFADLSMPQAATLPANAALFTRNRHRAFIKIQDGCRYRCTFCIVTVARGAERSRTIADIVEEVRALEADEVREVVLTGVHVGGYGSDLDTNLEALVKALLDDTDIPRIRFASVEPWDLSPGFLDLFANPRVQPHMHLPLQSGSDTVLRRMARRCKTVDFNALTQSLREAVPNFNITTDIIAGFPGETEQEWADSMDFIATQGFGHIHAFTYSERDGTRAATLPDSVPMEIRQQRSRQLHQLGDQLKNEQLSRSIGTVADVLWERGRQTSNEQGQSIWTHQGYTPNYQRVRTQSHENLANRILPVKLTGIEDGKLTGTSQM
ncbi:tRNA (N(6)-L-threonylcarbamoyladenosine(37)-C(2))-methylthiotransferase MtaB [Granulosicoccus antarcticus]|uniref:Threonylcarbamoyladenosine tRNA methylthiotransferase MtaB n=1 Tax=Granulosicoccus antarcticus IMCC3135 TaxID=1192854 RepID=A0A2Z2NRP0_9GAMM|nr:tRNA (N(6)-L-threonylcarbamoyladenosine(37)-C(2))-methylthiotransferase MtaB [Granulosicoccus antarcticus]ASJ72408.1 Threonylcarbamoyladenosine tRNA methylthiotransferase MtaB [Granulosicoccus antarcticus IMCC3135]